MALKITRSDEPLQVETLVTILYGQAGLGKTSIAATADAPLTLDFDRGSHRSQFRPDTVQVHDWTEVTDIDQEDLSQYQTLIIDTGGRALDAITRHIAKTQPKLTTSSGNLTLQGYGELKAIFATWLNRVRGIGKDVVIVAHDSEDKQGDDLIVRPDIQGGSKGELIKSGDVMGYLYMSNKRRVLDFNPSDRWVGKNPGGLDPVPVPDFNQKDGHPGGFLAKVLKTHKYAMNQLSNAQQETAKVLNDWRERVEAATDASQINALIPEIEQVPERLQRQARQVLHHRAKQLGLEADKEHGQYVDPAAEDQGENPAQGAFQQ